MALDQKAQPWVLVSPAVEVGRVTKAFLGGHACEGQRKLVCLLGLHLGRKTGISVWGHQDARKKSLPGQSWVLSKSHLQRQQENVVVKSPALCWQKGTLLPPLSTSLEDQ